MMDSNQLTKDCSAKNAVKKVKSWGWGYLLLSVLNIASSNVDSDSVALLSLIAFPFLAFSYLIYIGTSNHTLYTYPEVLSKTQKRLIKLLIFSPILLYGTAIIIGLIL